MSESRRDFLARAAGILSAASAASAPRVRAQTSASALQTTPVAGTPPAFGTAPPAAWRPRRAVGPEVAASDFAHAEKLLRLEMTPSEREQAAGNWREAMAGVMERRTGPRKVPLESTVSPATLWDPRIPGAP